MNIASKDLRFAVIHVGPRLHYAVPAVLEQAGMLQALYTDAHAGCGSLRPLKMLPGKFQPRGIRRLLSRAIPDSIPAEKVRSWLYPSLQIEWLNRMVPHERKNAGYWHQHRIGGHWLAKKAIDDNFGGANALYVHPCVSTEALREAKRRGMFVVLEAISHPLNKLVEAAEYKKYGLPSPEPEQQSRDNLAFFTEEAKLADLILAASPYVQSGLIDLGIDPSRVEVVPYGLDSNLIDQTPCPQPGRVISVGNVGYLKGIPYLAAAARQLATEGFAGEIRAIGSYDAGLLARPEFIGPNYIGQVPRSDVKNEFLAADVFVFPTLSDGFGIVLLEAMAAGVPVVCTPNCAQLVVDGQNGFVVDALDPGGLAEGIKKIVGDRALRSRLGAAALGTAAENTLEDYRHRLVAAISKHHQAAKTSQAGVLHPR